MKYTLTAILIMLLLSGCENEAMKNRRLSEIRYIKSHPMAKQAYHDCRFKAGHLAKACRSSAIEYSLEFEGKDGN